MRDIERESEREREKERDRPEIGIKRVIVKCKL